MKDREVETFETTLILVWVDENWQLCSQRIYDIRNCRRRRRSWDTLQNIPEIAEYFVT